MAEDAAGGCPVSAPSFRQWLSQWTRQHPREHDILIHDLAYDVIRDSTWPRGAGSLARYEEYLRHEHACPEAIEALHHAWAAYRP